MRHPPQRFLRAIVVLPLLQVTVVGAWVPHALASRAEAVAHVEAAGASSCPVSHDDGHCLICQATTLRVLGADTVRLQVPEIVTGSGSPRAPSAGIATGSPSARYPRAPPVVAA